MCFNPSPERRVPSPNRYMAFVRFCFCKNNKRTIIIDTTWLFEGGRALLEFFARHLKEKTGTRMMSTKAIEREVAKNDNNHVPSSVDAYTVASLKEWFEDTDIATGKTSHNRPAQETKVT